MPAWNNDPLVYTLRSGQLGDEFIDINLQYKIVQQKILLDELPDPITRVSINGMVETQSINPELNQFYCNYHLGTCHFNVANEGQTVSVNWKGRGNAAIPISRIWTQIDSNGDVIETLEQMINNYNLYTESVRVANEITRESNEDTREVAETTRQNQETARVNAEAARVIAENERVVNNVLRSEFDTHVAENTQRFNTLHQVFLMDFPRIFPENDDTGRLQRAVDYLIVHGGGSLVLVPEMLTVNGEVYVKPTGNVPVYIKGCNDKLHSYSSGNGTIINRDVTGTIFNVNLNSDGSSYLATDKQFSNFAIEGIHFKNTTWNNDVASKRFSVTGMTAIKVFRTNGAYRNISSYGFDYTVHQPLKDVNNADNYCDLSVYDHFHIYKCCNVGIETVRGDGDSYSSIFSGDNYITFKNLLNIRLSGAFIAQNILHSNWGDWQGGTLTFKADTSDDSAIIRTESSKGTIVGVHTENNYNTSIIKCITSLVDVKGLHSRFDDKYIIWSDNSTVTIDDLDLWSDKISGYSDIKVTGTTSIYRHVKVGNFYAESYDSPGTTRGLTTSGVSSPIIKEKVITIRVAYTGSAWIVRDLDNNDISGMIPVQWDPTNNDGLLFTNITNAKACFMQERYISGQPYIRPIYNTNSPNLKLTFVDATGARVLAPNNGMQFFIQLVL